jgi:hypothetical protein
VTQQRQPPKKRDVFGKALQLLWHMVDAPSTQGKGWGVRELSPVLGVSPASVHRLLTMLAEHGLMQRHPRSGRYHLGSEAFRLGLSLAAHLDLRNVGTPVMEELVAQCNETAFLGMFDPARMEVMFVAAVNSKHPLRWRGRHCRADLRSGRPRRGRPGAVDPRSAIHPGHGGDVAAPGDAARTADHRRARGAVSPDAPMRERGAGAATRMRPDERRSEARCDTTCS